jgi:hypothetical protein
MNIEIKEDNKRYILFKPWRGGYVNIIMSYQLALALSYITKRTIIIPKNQYILFLSIENEKKHG